MAILLTSSNPLGLRAVGSGGKTAVASYGQITRTLRQMLGPDHAALFAEPNERAAKIDWFADVEARGTPIRLTAAPAAVRERGLARLDTLMRDIMNKTVSLQKSDRQDERILGDMLAHAIEIPDEDAVFLVGEQPVLTFWGYVKDQGRPAINPIHTLLKRRAQTTPGSDLAGAGRAGSVTGNPAGPRNPERETAEAARQTALPMYEAAQPLSGSAQPIRQAAPVVRLPAAALWAVFALLLLTCGVQLLRGCAIGFPHALTGWLLDSCHAPAGDDSGAEADERARQAEYQAQYDELIREAALSRQACLITQHRTDEPVVTPLPDPVVPKPDPVLQPLPKPDPIPAPQPEPAPVPQQQMQLPPANDDKTDFLEGCWRAQDELFEIIDGKRTGRKLKATYCFNKDGTGTRTIRYEKDNVKCVGPMTARRIDDILTIDLGNAPCEANHGNFVAATAKCRRGQAGEARCDQIPTGSKKPEFQDFPFTRTDEQP